MGEQFKEHWAGEISIIGGTGVTGSTLQTQQSLSSIWPHNQNRCIIERHNSDCESLHGEPLKVYVYHGNARRSDPHFLAGFDVVITTYSTLATEYSKQNRSIASENATEEDADSVVVGKSASGYLNFSNSGLPAMPKGHKRKKGSRHFVGAMEASSPLQSIHWFRVVLDEAQYVIQFKIVTAILKTCVFTAQ